MDDIDLPHLRALAAVIDSGSFEAAAAVLHVTPSAVSQRIKALESRAGRVLLQRTRPAVVTEAGMPYLRLARQLDALLQDVAATEQPGPHVPVPLAINGDSLSTWVLPALAGIEYPVAFTLHREDQDHSAELLRSGTVMAAITTDSRPVQGCTVTRLGLMRYRPMASPAFVARWFGGGATVDELAVAPVVTFDAKDDLQDRYLRARTRKRLDPPRQFVPSTPDFADAVRLGLGWGMLPVQQSAEDERAGTLVLVDPDWHLDVELYWQQWSLHTPALDAIATAILAAASKHLD